MDEELDLVTFSDDDGNEITMEVLDYFFYEGQEYAILSEYDEEACGNCEAEECGLCEQNQDAYIMKIVPVGDDEESFENVEDEALMQKLIDFVQNDLYADEDDDDFDEDEEFEDASDPE